MSHIATVIRPTNGDLGHAAADPAPGALTALHRRSPIPDDDMLGLW
jgi:hypothetical protein